MLDQYSRTEFLFGKEAMERLKNSRMAVFGIADTAELPAHCVRRPFTSPSCDREALTKSLPQFWFSDSPQDSLKTAQFTACE